MWQSIKSRIDPSDEKIYILPTRAGALFIASTLVMLLVGSGYTNNLVNVLAFFMFSLIFVSMVLTQLQLKGLTLDDLEILPAFAGSESEISAWLKNETRTERFGIVLSWEKPSPVESGPQRILPQSRSRVHWSARANGRGLHRLSRIEFHSVYPLGLFQSWKVLHLDTAYWVYPQPIGALPFPQLRAGETSDLQASAADRPGDDFRGHRRYLPGDSVRQIDWKAYARGRPLLIKEINAGEPPELIFDWKDLDHTGWNDEEKLSQLSAWIRQAEQQGRSFTLRLPGQPEICGSGVLPAHRCLERLALFGSESVGAAEPGASPTSAVDANGLSEAEDTDRW